MAADADLALIILSNNKLLTHNGHKVFDRGTVRSNTKFHIG